MPALQWRAATQLHVHILPDGYAKYELLLQALESALEYAKLLLDGAYQPENSQGRMILQLCDEIGNNIHFPGWKTDSDSD